jgi:hypothetical protein
LQVKPLEIKDCLRPIPGGKAAYEAEHKIRNDLPAHQLLASCSGADYYQSRIAPLKKKARVLFEGERGIASARPHAFADQVQTAPHRRARPENALCNRGKWLDALFVSMILISVIGLIYALLTQR